MLRNNLPTEISTDPLWASALFATSPQIHAKIGLLTLRSANLLSLPSHPVVANSALDFALSSIRLGDSIILQTDGMVCMQGIKKATGSIPGGTQLSCDKTRALVN